MKLPKSWQQISIGQFQQLQKLTEPTLDNQIKTLSILSGRTTDEIEDLPIVEMERQLTRLAFMSELPTAKNLTAFHSGNYVYRFAANQHQLTAGQFITVQDLFAGGNWIDNLHKIMAALCVPYRIMLPKRMELKAVDFESTAELFQKKMPISLAYAYTLFFSTCLPELLEAIQVFLEAEAKELKKTAESANGQG